MESGGKRIRVLRNEVGVMGRGKEEEGKGGE